MFARTIIDSDLFLDMPATTQALYFHLAMRADDDGFVNNPKKIQRMMNGSDDDLKLLIAKQFIIPFENGIVVIRHWKLHNYIAKDRYTETNYKQEKETLTLENGAYRSVYTGCIQDVDNLSTQVRLGKVSKDKVRLDKDIDSNSNELPPPPKKIFIPPLLEEVNAYCQEKNYNVDPEAFIAYYNSNGWMVGSHKMKSWKDAVVTWAKRSNNNYNAKSTYQKPETYADRLRKYTEGLNNGQERNSDDAIDAEYTIPKF